MPHPAELAASFYPERETAPESFGDRAWSRGLFWMHRRFGRRMADPTRFAGEVAEQAARVPDRPLDQGVLDLRYRLRRDALSDELLAECFALYSIALGAEFPAAVLGAARALAHGGIVQLPDLADRRGALALAACAMALRGTPVHLLAASPARASALAQDLRAPLAALGFRVALVTPGADASARADAYSRLVVCGTLRDVGLDYLRDRIALGGRPRKVLGTLERLAGEHGRKPLLQGMQCALIDEADEVMLDDSRMPLTLSAEAHEPGERLLYEQALELARALDEHDDFTIGPERTQLTPHASERLGRLTQALGGGWALRERREDLIALALDALYVLERGRDYRVIEGGVVFPPRPDRDAAETAEEATLQKLVEVKEGCRLSGRRVVVAQMTVPRVLGRYLHLAGTCHDAGGLDEEFWRLYRLRTVRAGQDSQRFRWSARLFASGAHWKDALLSRIRDRASNEGLVIALRSQDAAQALLAACKERGIEAGLVGGAGDATDEQVVARLDRPGAVLISLYPAQRAVQRPTASSGAIGLIVAELHDSERRIAHIARAYGVRSCELLLSLEDEALGTYLDARTRAAAAREAAATGEAPSRSAVRCIKTALRNAQAGMAVARREAFSLERSLDELLAFSGERE